MEGSLAFLYAALGVTLFAIVGYLLVLKSRLRALRGELARLERGDTWIDRANHEDERGRANEGSAHLAE